MTDKMPDETAQEIVDNPSTYTDTELKLANSYLGLLDIYLSADAANNEEIAALKAEHRAEMAVLCDEILKTLESESEYATDNIDEDRLYVRWTDVELIINKIKQRISDE